MKKLKYIQIISLLFVLSFNIISCKKNDEPTPLTVIEKISKSWQVSKVFVNGQEDTSGLFNSFTITFTNESGVATTYSLQVGNAIDLPTQNTAGTWVLESTNTRIVFDKGTVTESSIEVIGTISETGLSIQWQVPETIDKTKPIYTLELIPV